MDECNDIFEKISGLIPEQFPAVYVDRGPLLVAFTKAYYEWLEEPDNVINKSRNLLKYSDIDTTPEAFLVHFQKKYLYGVPFDVIINKRLLLKHIFDAYRSKSSVQCFELLFRLIYNEDMDVYIPGNDLLRPSDGTWKDVRYLEVSTADVNADFVGKQIIGLSSQTTAMVESFIQEPVNQNIINSLFISNISPRGGVFERNEKLILKSDYLGENYGAAVAAGPVITGSLGSIDIIDSDQSFEIGDIVKIASRDLTTNEPISSGRDGLLVVKETQRGRGSIRFSLLYGGYGHQANSSTILYKDPLDSTGIGASFRVGSLAAAQDLSYNTDILCELYDVQIGATQYGLASNTSANSGTPLEDALGWANAVFGSVTGFADIRAGAGYTHALDAFIRTPNYTTPLSGTISYNSASKIVTGTSTVFERCILDGFAVMLQANTALAETFEEHVVKEVFSNTSLELYGFPTHNSTPSATLQSGPDTLTSQFPANSSIWSPDYTDLVANVVAFPIIGTGVAKRLEPIESGKGYIESEIVEIYRSGGIDAPSIEAAGTGYANGDTLIFSGGDPLIFPEGTVSTDGSGGIIGVTMTNNGSGFKSVPTIIVRTIAGEDAVLTTMLNEFDTSSFLTGRINKTSIGKQRGYWSTTRSFLNSDKYIQDSYFYQDFSYQIEAPLTLDKYSSILYDTFHIASTELFGKFKLNTTDSSLMSVAYSNNTANTFVPTVMYGTVDRDDIFVDNFAPTIDYVE